MTYQEAIEIIKIAIAEVEWYYPMEYSIAFETAIEALELATRAESINYKSVSKCISADYCHGWNDAVRKLKGEDDV